jgi:hypothetical protein
MDAVLDPGKTVELPRQGAVIDAFEAGVRFEDQDHGNDLESRFSLKFIHLPILAGNKPR